MVITTEGSTAAWEKRKELNQSGSVNWKDCNNVANRRGFCQSDASYQRK